MRPILFLSLLSLAPLLSSCVIDGKRQFVFDYQKDENVRVTPLDIDTYAEIYAEDDGVYLYRENYIEMVHKGSSLLTQDLQTFDSWYVETMRYLVLDPDAEELSTFDLALAPGVRLMNAHIKVIDPDGGITHLDISDMNVETDSDGARRYRVAYPGVKKGTIVDVGYETLEDPRRTGHYHHELPLQYRLPCEQLRIQVVHPTHWRIKIRGGVDATPNRDELYQRRVDGENRVAITTYDAHDIPALYNEPWSPYRNERLRYIEIALVKYRGSPITESWAQYADKLFDYYVDGYSPRQVKVDLERNSDDEGSTIRAVLDWVHEKVRHKALDPSIRYDPVEAIERGEGRSAEITVLTKLLLQKVGIVANFVLIHSVLDPPVFDDFVAPGRYYFPGLELQSADSTLLLFPWISRYPAGHIPGFLQQQPMLVFGQSGFLRHDSAGTGAQGRDITTSEYNAEIDEEGQLTMVEVRRLEGEDAFFLRRRMEEFDDEELDEEMKDLIIYEGGEIDFEGYDIENREEYNRPLIITLRYTIDGLVTITPDEAIVRIEELFSPSFSYKRKVETSERVNPIRIYTDEEVSKTVTLRVPENWQVGSLPEDLREETSFGTATASYRYRPGELTATYSRSLRRSERPAEHYQELLLLIGRDSKLNLSTLVFTY